MAQRSTGGVACAACLVLGALSCAVGAQDAWRVETGSSVNASVGQVGIFDDLEDPGIAGLEFRWPLSGRRPLTTAAGIAGAESGASFVYFDLHYDHWLNERWLLSPSVGVGRFHADDFIDLGHPLEFRSGIEIAYRFDNNVRAGLVLLHFSNGGISEPNPGVEELSITLSVPLGD